MVLPLLQSPGLEPTITFGQHHTHPARCLMLNAKLEQWLLDPHFTNQTKLCSLNERLVGPLQAIDSRPQHPVTHLPLGRGCSGLEGRVHLHPHAFPGTQILSLRKEAPCPTRRHREARAFTMGDGDPAICWSASVCPVAEVTWREEPVRAAGSRLMTEGALDWGTPSPSGCAVSEW